MKVTKLINILQSLPKDTEVSVNAWSSREDYDRTDDIKVCTLGGSKVPQVIICDKKTEYYSREVQTAKTIKTKEK